SGRPSYSMRPPPRSTTPEIARKSVVLPAPFGPTIATNSPALTSMETSCSACSPPYDTEMLSSRSTCSPLLAEVRFDHVRQVDHRRGTARRDRFTVVEHDEAVGEPHHGMHRVLDDDDRHAF